MSVTSTDISSLYAKAQHVARRHYGCNIVRTEYYKELAARIVVAAVARYQTDSNVPSMFGCVIELLLQKVPVAFFKKFTGYKFCIRVCDLDLFGNLMSYLLQFDLKTFVSRIVYSPIKNCIKVSSNKEEIRMKVNFKSVILIT